MTRVLPELDIIVDTFEWSLERYHDAIKAGVLTEYDAVELIHGKLVKKMPISDDHAAIVEAFVKFFITRFGFDYRYRSENPVSIIDNSEPEPDFVVAQPIKGKQRHPTPEEIHLIIEVAHSTLQYDRKVKGPIYASAGIPEYWIVNLKASKLEVHLSPAQEEGVFENVRSYGIGDVFESPFVGEVAVSDILLSVEEE